MSAPTVERMSWSPGLGRVHRLVATSTGCVLATVEQPCGLESDVWSGRLADGRWIGQWSGFTTAKQVVQEYVEHLEHLEHLEMRGMAGNSPAGVTAPLPWIEDGLPVLARRANPPTQHVALPWYFSEPKLERLVIALLFQYGMRQIGVEDYRVEKGTRVKLSEQDVRTADGYVVMVDADGTWFLKPKGY